MLSWLANQLSIGRIFWAYVRMAPIQPGQYTVLSKANDSCRFVQLMKHDADNSNYMVGLTLPISVVVV